MLLTRRLNEASARGDQRGELSRRSGAAKDSTMTLMPRLAGAILLLCASPAPAASETSAKPEPNVTRDCIKYDSDFKRDGTAGLFVVELTNTCEQRLRCTVNAYVITAF